MSLISPSEVKRIAGLARIQLSDQEVEQATKDLANILGHFAQLQSIDTSHTPTSDDVTGLSNVTRADQVEADVLCPAQTLLDNAPDTHQKQIKVSAIFA